MRRLRLRERWHSVRSSRLPAREQRVLGTRLLLGTFPRLLDPGLGAVPPGVLERSRDGLLVRVPDGDGDGFGHGTRLALGEGEWHWLGCWRLGLDFVFPNVVCVARRRELTQALNDF